MKTLYIRQKIVSLNDRFSVTDIDQVVQYTIEGSFIKIPKQYTIFNASGDEVAEITRKLISLLPVFTVDFNAKETITIKKHFSFLKEKLTIEGAGIVLTGDLFDLHFDIQKDGETIGAIQPKIFSWADTYELTILNEQYEEMIVALTVAIDRIKEESGSLFSGISLFD